MSLSAGAAVDLKRGAMTAFAGRAAGVALLFAMNAVLGRQLGPSQYGIFSFGLSLTALLLVLAPLGWTTAIMRLINEYTESAQWPLLRGVLWRGHQLALAGGLAAAMLLLAISVLPAVPVDVAAGCRFAAVLLPLAVILHMGKRSLQGLHRVVASIVPDEVLLPGFVLAIVIALGLRDVFAAMTAYAVVLLAVTLANGYLLRSKLPPEIHGATTQYQTKVWMAIALPMLLGGLSQAVINRTDVLMLGVMDGMSGTGLYNAANRIAQLNVFVLSAINVIAAPMLAREFHAGRQAAFRTIFWRVTGWSGAGALPVFLAMLLAAPWLMGLFGSDFVAGSPLLQVLAVGQFLNAITGPVGYALLMAGQEKAFAFSMAVMAAVNVAGNLIAIPLAGPLGAAVVSTLSVLVLNAWQLWLVVTRVMRSR